MGILGDIIKVSVGVNLGNKALIKEMKKESRQNQAAEERRQAQIRREENDRKHKEAIQSQRNWEAVRKANEERRRKGQPELPLPPRWYY